MTRSRSAASTGSPAASRSASTAMPSAPVPARSEDQLERVDARPVEHDQAVDGGQPLARLAHGGDRVAEQRLAVALEERPRRVGAGQDRARRAGGGGGLHAGVEARRVQPLGAREQQRRLAPGRQRLVRADDQRVRAELERVPRQVGVEAEVRRPRRVDDERDVVLVGRGREAGDVADRADVRRVAHEHGPRVGVPGERVRHGRGRDAERQPAGGVDLGPYPDGFEARRAPGRAASSGAGSG